MKTILGLDLGTNSIGWALVQQDFENKYGKILGMGSRIIPMSQDILGDFDKGNSVSQTAERTGYRGVRRLRERYLQRRERLHRILHLLGFLPAHYEEKIDFENRLGQFIGECEPKIVYKPIWNEEKQKNVYQFVFEDSFQEMISDFSQYQPEILKDKNGNDCLVPHDWTIYYLRKKALTQKITKEELAWIILNFNQKRGYYQLRGEEEEENPNKLVEFYSLKVVGVVPDAQLNAKKELWYSVHLENGWIYRRSSKAPLDDWLGKTRDFIVTTDLNEDGSIKTDKEGNEKRSFRAPGEDDWTLLKKKTEHDIDISRKTVGTYIYDNLLKNPHQKIRGKLVRTIERKYYKAELKEILEKQIELQPELFTDDLYNDCVRELYRNNDLHQLELSKRDFVHLIVEDIIFYQRHLRSKKNTISDCPFESHKYTDDKGIEHKVYLKSIPKSNPYYQEFRVWQWLQNLKIYTKEPNSDIPVEFIKTEEDKVKLFDFLMRRNEVDHKDILGYFLKPILKERFPDARPKAFNKELDKEIARYRWNYVYDDSGEGKEATSKKYPMNETRYDIANRLKTAGIDAEKFLTREIEYRLWHLIYSVTDAKEFENGLGKFALKYHLDKKAFVDAFKKMPPYKSDYGSYSEKAIKKLLPLMRLGKYWDSQAIMNGNDVYMANIRSLLKKLDDREKKITDEERETWNKSINHKLYETLQDFQHADVSTFQGLPLHIAQYLVYGRHSEGSDLGKWESAADLEKYLQDFKQHSLRNPIVEQVMTETLRVVKDIWEKYGNGEKDFFSEIHIELGREMKLPSEERKSLTNKILENESTNLRIKALLVELANDGEVENVRPYSPMQQEILRIFEDGVLKSVDDIEEDILKISKTPQPSVADLRKYKLWLEQKYRSPYTGQMIPLNKLFTPAYEIEHIIPQSRYFDDSFTNKVICEAEVNKLKDRQLGLEFIKNHHGETVTVGGNTVQILSVDAYEAFVKNYYTKNRAKQKKLLLEEIPDKMIERQMNDTRYISKYISAVLSKIVRKEEKDDGVNSVNVIPTNGAITNELKQDWGLNDVWNSLILPRFERMNQLTNSTVFTAWNDKFQKFLPTVPLEYSKGFQKKRIDHRHHAMDALVIACATKDHVNLLNNQTAKSDKRRYDLNRKLRIFERTSYTNPHGERVERDIPKAFKKPWDTFTEDAKKELSTIIVSFKQNLRIINKASNYYEKWEVRDGQKVKVTETQKGTNWAIRKSLHKDTVFGKVDLPRVKVPKGKILTATRKNVDTSFTLKVIDSITDTGIQKILKNYLKAKGEHPEIAFTPEGIEEMNQNIRLYNDGKDHKPIQKVRIFELGSKFPLGEKGNKKDKYVEAAKGTNLFFAIYEDANGKRSYDTIPLNIVIERQKQGLNPVPEQNEKGHRLLFTLSPNDLVYIPTEDAIAAGNVSLPTEWTDKEVKRIYKIVSFTGNRLYGIPYSVANAIVNKVEYSQLNKIEFIGKKSACLKLNVDRLGNISKP